MIYGTRANNRPHGTVLTKSVVVEAMLDVLGYTADRNLSQLAVIDPCGGEGAFICACIQRLAASARRHGFSFTQAYDHLKVVEINAEMIRVLRSNIQLTLQHLGLLETVTDWERILIQGDFLLYQGPEVDIVVGNPPYVRHDNLPDHLKHRYKQLFSTFRNRCDLYIAFYQKGLQLLKPGGKLSFICANRWLKNQYGKALRQLIEMAYTLEWNINLEQAEPFDEKVDAYASITQIQRGKSLVYPEIRVSDLEDLSYLARHGEPPTGFPAAAPEPTFPLALIEEQGFVIGIGVATGADKVFISQLLVSEFESDCFLPLVMGKDVQGESITWSGHYVFNPWDSQGVLRDLNQYPQTKAYLESHYETLSARYIARKNPSRWFQLIDKIKPGLLEKPKILLADISRNHWVTIDEGRFYPHHNLYWITGPGLSELKLLACFLMSEFVHDQLQQLSPLMNGGFARWQSQHLRKLRVPILNQLPEKMRTELLQAYDERQLPIIRALTNQVLLSSSEYEQDIVPSNDFAGLPLFALYEA
jgi:adenine-specific DNA-methyltransferase